MSKSTLFALALVTLATNIHSAAVKPEVDLNKCRVSNCGKTGPNFIQPRVIGGRAAKVDEFPFHAAIFTRPLSARPGRVHQNNLKCGGNMINDQWILTSAECVWDVPVDEIRVSVAIVDIGEEGDNGIQVEQVIVHPAFVPDEEHDDIALLKVKSIKASSHHFVNPICLPFADMEKDVQMATVAGFGAIHPNTDPQDSLQMTTLPIQPDSVCKAIYFDLFNSTSMICAGDLGGKRDTCSGDSGGPLTFRSNGSYVLKGLTSFSMGCGKKDVAAVYTKVSHYLNWTCETMLTNGYLGQE